MAIYLKKFETQAAYEAAESSLILPNVSLTVDNNAVHYKPYVEPIETRVVAKFNVTDTSNPTKIGYYGYTSGFSSIEIDGVEQPSVVSAYTFSTTGEHTVKYTLTDQTTIGNYAFTNCNAITSVTIPNSVTTIGWNAFNQCTSLTSIDVPNNVTTIGSYAFQECTGLTTCTIGSGVTRIGMTVLGYCRSLTSLTVNNNNTVYDSRNECNAIIETSTNKLIQGCQNTVIPNGVTSIGDSAFRSCSGLTSIVIPDSVTSIGNSAFEYCTSLTSCTIGSGVTSIAQYAFNNCTSLTSIDIPSGATWIGDSAFYRCNGLMNVTVNPTTPPRLGEYCDDDDNCYYRNFDNNASGRKIYVPSESVEVYKSTNGWKAYASNIQAIS